MHCWPGATKTGHCNWSFAIFDTLPASSLNVYQKSPGGYTAEMKEAHRDQIVPCPHCYTRMRVRCAFPGEGEGTFEKFITCLNPGCKHVFVALLSGPFLEGPFPIR